MTFSKRFHLSVSIFFQSWGGRGGREKYFLMGPQINNEWPNYKKTLQWHFIAGSNIQNFKSVGLLVAETWCTLVCYGRFCSFCEILKKNRNSKFQKTHLIQIATKTLYTKFHQAGPKFICFQKRPKKLENQQFHLNLEWGGGLLSKYITYSPNFRQNPCINTGFGG